jgi:PadR family transcriptional regulator PadR
MAGPSGWGTTTSLFSPAGKVVSASHLQEKALAKITLDTSYTMLYTVYTVHCMEHSTSGDLFENLRLELRRGCLVLAVLAALRSEQYGYTLRKALADQGVDIDEGTLYPLLRRLESQGLLASEWREHDKRNKRFYRLSAEGETMRKLLFEEWQALNRSLNSVLEFANRQNAVR